jgi:hypothetical protein
MNMSKFNASFQLSVKRMKNAFEARKVGKTTCGQNGFIKRERQVKAKLSKRSADTWLMRIDSLCLTPDLKSHIARTVWWDYCKYMSYEDNRKFDVFQHRYLVEDPPEDVALALSRIGYTPYESYVRAKLPVKTHKTREEHPDDARNRT